MGDVAVVAERGIGCVRSAGAVSIARAVLRRGIEPFCNQHRLAAAQVAQAIKEVWRDPAVRDVYVVVDRDRVDMRRHRLHRIGIVIDRQPIAEI